MVTATQRLKAHAARDYAEHPAAWAALYPTDERVKWQVWSREKGPGYWVMRYATRLANFVNRVEAWLRGTEPQVIINPNGLEDGATFDTEEEAQDHCRHIYGQKEGRYSVTYTPIIVGRAYPVERQKRAAGERFFDPFKTFDFSATDAVKEQARHVLVSVDELRALTQQGERLSRKCEQV